MEVMSILLLDQIKLIQIKPDKKTVSVIAETIVLVVVVVVVETFVIVFGVFMSIVAAIVSNLLKSIIWFDAFFLSSDETFFITSETKVPELTIWFLPFLAVY